MSKILAVALVATSFALASCTLGGSTDETNSGSVASGTTATSSVSETGSASAQ